MSQEPPLAPDEDPRNDPGNLSLEMLLGQVDAEIAAAHQRTAVVCVEAAEPADLMIRFTVGDHVLAATADQMNEIESMPALTFVPQVPPVVSGLTNLRGEVIVVLDLGRYLGIDSETGHESEQRRMIVVRDAFLGRPVGVLVERILGISPIRHRLPGSTSAVLPEVAEPFVKGTLEEAGQEVTIIDLRAFASAAEAGTSWPAE